VRAERATGRGRRWWIALALALAGMLAATTSAQAATYPEAVLMVSGFDTASPFSTPDPNCNGKEGPEWSPAGGIAQTLKPAGLDVFTAPVRQTGEPLLAPCTGPGEAAPPDSAVINSNGELDANGQALANLIGFMRHTYGVEKLHLVGHSDGGLWSRSAITQDSGYAGLEVLSLTTLGTPHIGSLVADLAINLDGGKCDFTNKIEQLICESVVGVADLMLKDLGKVATTELTNGFLTGWNPKQRIGSCPVTGIAGNHVGFSIPLLGYYTPSDGAVGLSSALGESALAIDGSTIPAPGIPNFKQGGTYDVVHGLGLDFLDPANLLNTQAVSNEVRDTVLAAATNTTACNIGAGERDPVEVSHGLPLYRLVAPNRRGRLPRADAGELIAAKSGVELSCAGTKLEATAHRGDPRLALFETSACDKRPRVANGAKRGARSRRRAKAVLVDHAERNQVTVTIEGTDAQIDVQGPRVRRLRAVIWSGGQRERLALDRDGSATLPEGVERTWLRIRAKAKPGGTVASGTTLLSR
jgi:triacylglycerol lipase